MKGLDGTGALIRLILRRDRIRLPIWLVLTLGVVAGRAFSIESTYPTAAARQARFEEVMVDIPMFKLFQGPAYGADTGALFAQETFGGATIIAALGAVIFLVRHTRSEEQAGRKELLGSTVVGRHAQLAAALAMVLGSGALLAVLSVGAQLAAGLPAVGSLAFGLIVGGAVWVAAALAAVGAQLTESARAAGIGAFALFFAMHFVRGVSDLGGDGLNWLGWLVPNGWLQRARPFADERWWVFLLVAALLIALLWAAFALSSRRDLGAGMIPARPGPPTAPPSLRNPLGLAWRLHRSMALVWIVGTIFISLPAGFVGAEAMEQYAGSARMREWADAMGATNIGEAFFAYIAFAMGFPITIYAIMTLLRLSHEETSGHAEMLLSTPTGRARWTGSHLLLALAIPVVLQIVLGLSFGLGSGELGSMLTTTTSLIPAVWVMVGITMAAYGLLRRGAAIVGWGALIVALTVEFGQHLGWPEWIFKVFSPYAHVLPFYGPPSALTLFTLTLIAAILVGIGLAGIRRRDLSA